MKVSLIITVYNKEKFLKRCLDSIVRQTEKDAQIIIVDDGSTDGSAKICNDYAKKYGFEIYHTKNQGVAEARNFGMAKANGEYIAFLDADDAFTPDALEVMTKITRHEYNIYQFGQIRCKSGDVKATRPDRRRKGFCDFDSIPKRWTMVWNKLYKASFLKEHRIKFPKGYQFGEDELFNVKCILANGGLYHAPQFLMEHYFDDMNSLCRGELSLERLKKLEKALVAIANQQTGPRERAWVNGIITRHRNSPLFSRFGYARKASGHYDIVYFLKESKSNEELRYSLRSVEENFQYNRVWFYGGCPEGLMPDRLVKVKQNEPSKWERVRAMLRQVCENDEITEDFWLFNDDFFVLKPTSENMQPLYNGTLYEQIVHVEDRHGQRATAYTKRLRHLVKTLEEAKKECLNYAVHKPILINRKKMLEVLDKFPEEPMTRALYGNYWKIGGVSKHDMKIMTIDYPKMKAVETKWDFVSTADQSFEIGVVGEFLKKRFDKRSRFET